MEVLLWHGKASHREVKEWSIQMLQDVGISSPKQRCYSIHSSLAAACGNAR
ncbi:MAG: hypothetical protein BSOLF_1659 [Candidatus Carbobacillus altaicus]|uniref:Uncharacterized protein n=1 Tax=Candidatus Carbonibacillus altaicus TaxID=2163959 RepID=A0A2R6Y3V5_9BACL|nr:MAG: hypothetical protein BSOLF_1659 [Candidatus Carbobacillus altaicus]